MDAVRQVVSANYRDWSNTVTRWLARNANESTDTAKPLAAVEITNFEFRRSDREEAGFGCRMVCVGDVTAAVAEPADATRLEPLEGKMEIEFDGWDEFYVVGNRGQIINRGARLRLLPDGRIFALGGCY